MSQTVAAQMASPRALRSRNRASRLDIPPVTTRASSTQPFEDALTGEEEQNQQDLEDEDNILEFPQSNQNAVNRHTLEFDQNNRLRRADPNLTPTRFPTRPINRTQVEVQFDENDPDTFLERLISSRKGERRSRRTQTSEPESSAQTETNNLDPVSKRYSLRAQPSSAPNAERKRKSAAQSVRRLFRGAIGSEDEDEVENESEISADEGDTGRNTEEQEGGRESARGEENQDSNNEEEDTEMQEGGTQEAEEEEGIRVNSAERDQAQSAPSPELASAQNGEEEEEEEIDELEEADDEEIEDEEAVAATLELQRATSSPSILEAFDNENDDDYPVSFDEETEDDDFEANLDKEAVRAQKEKTLQRRQRRREEEGNATRKVQQQAEHDEEEEESEIDDDDTERAAQNSQFVVRYRYTIGQNNVGRKKWTEEETRCLMSAMDSIMFGDDRKSRLRPYHAVLQLHGKEGSIDNLLASRNNMQLKDKVRNEILRMKRALIEVPAWADRLFRTI